MEESKRERVGGGKEVLSPSLPNPTLSPFFLAHFSLRFPNYLKACYRLTTCIPSFPTFYWAACAPSHKMGFRSSVSKSGLPGKGRHEGLVARNDVLTNCFI